MAHAGLWFQLRYPRLRYEDKRRMLLDLSPRYAPVFYEDGWVVLRRARRATARSPETAGETKTQ